MCGIRSRSGDHREEEGEGNGIGRGVKLLSIFSVCLEWGVGGEIDQPAYRISLMDTSASFLL